MQPVCCDCFEGYFKGKARCYHLSLIRPTVLHIYCSVLFFYPSARESVGLLLCMRVDKTVPASLIRSGSFNQDAYRDKERCESLFSLICTETQKHPLLCPQCVPQGAT